MKLIFTWHQMSIPKPLEHFSLKNQNVCLQLPMPMPTPTLTLIKRHLSTFMTDSLDVSDGGGCFYFCRLVNKNLTNLSKNSCWVGVFWKSLSKFLKVHLLLLLLMFTCHFSTGADRLRMAVQPPQSPTSRLFFAELILPLYFCHEICAARFNTYIVYVKFKTFCVNPSV